jgi:hypothetical protein
VTREQSWDDWQDGLILSLARQIYDERCWDEMPVLADALEDAGCTDQAILSHCRNAGQHTRGCWLLDALLERDVARAGPRP